MSQSTSTKMIITSPTRVAEDPPISDLFKDITPLAGLAAWIVNPPSQMGSTTSGLTYIQSRTDFASRNGCKTQSYTSWNSLSRSFVVRIVHAGLGIAEEVAGLGLDKTRPLVPDIPRTLNKTLKTRENTPMHRNGKEQFFRGAPTITQGEYAVKPKVAKNGKGTTITFQSTKKQRARQNGRCTPETVPASSTPSTTSIPPPKNEGASTLTAPPPTPGKEPSPDTTTTEEEQSETDDNDGQEDDNISGCYSDFVPVRVVQASPWIVKYEQAIRVPYSPIFTSIIKQSMMWEPPIIDDSFETIAKYAAGSATSVMEVAASVRLGCLIMSLSKQCYTTEIIQRRIIRGWTDEEYVGFEINVDKALYPQCYITAMPLDTFVAHIQNKTNFSIRANHDDMTPEFLSREIDITWTAVPIKQKHLNSSYLIPYIAAFLTSSLSSGKINHVYRGSYRNAGATRKIRSAVRTMPAANCVHIEGPKKVILVLVEATSKSCPNSVELAGISVPVFFAKADVMEVDFTHIWTRWFSNVNAHMLEGQCVLALNEITSYLSVENSSNIALAMVAELYTAMYMGLAVEPETDAPAYNWVVPAMGAWSLFDNDVLSTESRLRTDFWSPDQNESDSGGRRMVGYNFTALTCWHLPSTGCVMTEDRPSIFENAGPMRVWKSDVPSYQVPNYTISTVLSVNRIAIGLGLILTHELGKTIQSARGYGSFVHMLSTATAAQASLIFSQTNINLSMWAGYNSRRNEFHARRVHQVVIDMATNGIASYTNIQELTKGWKQWDEGLIMEYFGINPFTDVNWLSYTPLPHHFIQQWSRMINFKTGEPEKKYTYLTYNNENYFRFMFNRDVLQYRSLMSATIDADRYFPMVSVREPAKAHQYLVAWVDQWHYLSNTSAGNRGLVDPSYLESNELVLSLVENGLTYAPAIDMCVVHHSNYVHATEDIQVMRFSNIEWAGYIDQKAIIAAAKNYMVSPALGNS